MTKKRLLSLLVLTFTMFGASFFAVAQEGENHANGEATEAHGEGHEGKLDVAHVIFGHIADSHEWHLFSLKNSEGHHTEVALPLPVIIYNPEKGLSVFSFSKLAEGEEHEGYVVDRSNNMKERIVVKDNPAAKIYDLSITKNVLSMLISIALLLWLTLSAAKKYKKMGNMKAPSGFQNALEAIIIFIRDEVAKPYLGKKYHSFLPFLLTVFFFIWINNILGLLPGGANFTGNIAVTACLAILSFILILVNSNKHYWSHMLNPPGVPLGIKFLLVPIEIMSLFIKPMALMIRLFANIIAGHIMIIAVISMIFIFAVLNKYVGVGFVPVSLGFSIFMFLIELLVGAIQAFIFANLSAVFIGQALEGAHDEEHGHGHEHEEAII
jgi:F-type H+-transporting ATPase subunit a